MTITREAAIAFLAERIRDDAERIATAIVNWECWSPVEDEPEEPETTDTVFHLRAGTAETYFEWNFPAVPAESTTKPASTPEQS